MDKNYEPKEKKMKNNKTNKKIIEEIGNEKSFSYLNKRNEINRSVSQSELHIQEVKSLIKNPDQFCWIFGIEMGYHLPPKNFISWPYIFKVLSGEKKLMKVTRITLTLKIPKIEQLSVKKIWSKVKDNRILCSYMPILTEQRQPPRLYLFQIIKAVDPGLFTRIIEDATELRRNNQKIGNKIVEVDSCLLKEIKSACKLTSTLNQTISKRVNVKPVKRIKRNN